MDPRQRPGDLAARPRRHPADQIRHLAAGFFIIAERQYGFGDLIITPNGSIAQLTNLSRDWARAVIDVPFPLTVDIGRATEVLRQVGHEVFADEELHPQLALRGRIAAALRREGINVPIELDTSAPTDMTS